MDEHAQMGSFIDEALNLFPGSRQPDPTKDFGTYKQMSAAFEGLGACLDEWRRNYGKIGYATQNSMSDFTKEFVRLVQIGDEEGANWTMRAIDQLAGGFGGAVRESALPDEANQFGRTIEQERMEAKAFAIFWPVIASKSDEVGEILSWKKFEGNVQAYLYGFLDVVSELAKALDPELSKPSITTEMEFALYERYIAVAESIVQRLAEERHFPGYVISNGYGRWMAYTTKLRTAAGTIAHVRREYNLRCSMLRMVKSVKA